jgi:hypothetical protein
LWWTLLTDFLNCILNWPCGKPFISIWIKLCSWLRFQCHTFNPGCCLLQVQIKPLYIVG